MTIYITVEGSPHRFKADVSPAWAKKHDNGALISCGLTAPKDVSLASLEWLSNRGRLTKVTEEEYQHSGCQSSCTRRGDRDCHW